MSDEREYAAASLIDAAELTRAIGELYQLPVGDFVSARNQLARRVKKQDREAAGLIKELTKPSLSAWAANQVYWRARAVFDALIDAGENVRILQEGMLAGKPADGDLSAAMSAQRAAQTRALEVARQALADNGHSTNQSVLRRVTTTLEALATHGRAAGAPPHGRLSEDVPARGFGAFAALTSGPTVARVPHDPRKGNDQSDTEGAPVTPLRPEHQASPAEASSRRQRVESGNVGRVLAHPRAVERAADKDDDKDRPSANDNQVDRAAEKRRARAKERMAREQARRDARRLVAEAHDDMVAKKNALERSQAEEKEALDRVYEAEKAVAVAERELAHAVAARDVAVDHAERAKRANEQMEAAVRDARAALADAEERLSRFR